jgi:hypothetical protein
MPTDDSDDKGPIIGYATKIEATAHPITPDDVASQTLRYTAHLTIDPKPTRADRLLAIPTPRSRAVDRARKTLDNAWLGEGSRYPLSNAGHWSDEEIAACLHAARVLERAAYARRGVAIALAILDVPIDTRVEARADHRARRALRFALEVEVSRRVHVHVEASQVLRKALHKR